jgi:predicted nuclease with TOPRIM domain
MTIPTTKWFWIPVAILILVALVYAGGKWQTAKYEKAMSDLKGKNTQLQTEAKKMESDLLKRANESAQRSREIQVKLDRLQKDYVNLDKQYQTLQIERTRLETEYEALRGRLAAIQVPADRATRVELFRKLGYR